MVGGIGAGIGYPGSCLAVGIGLLLPGASRSTVPMLSAPDSDTTVSCGSWTGRVFCTDAIHTVITIMSLYMLIGGFVGCPDGSAGR